MTWKYDDGGRWRYFRGSAGDCVTRAIAIATEQDYRTVYDALNAEAKRERPRDGRSRSSAREGVYRQTWRRYMERLGWTWTPTMAIGTGTRVHLRADELPRGRLVVQCSRHVVAVIDGVIHDTDDPSREGTRAVYGYFAKGDA